jgi:hypothetical protein
MCAFMKNDRVQNGLEYLEDNPTMWHWVNRCPACGSIGYKPELADDSKSNCPAAAAPLRTLFPCLAIHDDGRCDRCHQKSSGWGPYAAGFGMDE